jgi:signal transduction histidine kinase
VKLYLNSDDSEVHRLCQEVLGEILGRGWTLHIGKGSEPEPEGDLFIWDWQAAEAIPSIDSAERWRHFFLVSRTSIDQFLESAGPCDLNVLLKPLTKASLTAYLKDACNRRKEQPAREENMAATLDSLRSDRDELLQCLLQANLRLQEYDQDRTNFLARAIHDFRAPLTAISGYCGLLLAGDLGVLTTEQRDVLERMAHSTKRLSRMASSMFQLSIAPRVERTVDLQKGDIRECIEQALHETGPIADEKRISITLNASPCPEPLFFERAKLEQVLINLLDNACKFTPRGGSIEITGTPYFWDRRLAGRTGLGTVTDRRSHELQAPNCYRVDVRDSGPGISPLHLKSVFEEYTSYAGGQDRSGGGMGLAICHMILNQHRGHIWAESTGTGALFSFVLPFSRSASGGEVHAERTFHAEACL